MSIFTKQYVKVNNTTVWQKDTSHVPDSHYASISSVPLGDVEQLENIDSLLWSNIGDWSLESESKAETESSLDDFTAAAPVFIGYAANAHEWTARRAFRNAALEPRNEAYWYRICHSTTWYVAAVDIDEKNKLKIVPLSLNMSLVECASKRPNTMNSIIIVTIKPEYSGYVKHITLYLQRRFIPLCRERATPYYPNVVGRVYVQVPTTK